MKQKCLYDGDVYVGVMILMIMVMMNHCSASAMKQIIVIEMIVMVVLHQGLLCSGVPLGAWCLGTK